MGQFLPEIKNIFLEIRRYRLMLEEKVDSGQRNYSSNNSSPYNLKNS